MLRGQLTALVEGDGDAQLGMDQQVVLDEELGEQHPVPLLVGAFFGEAAERSFSSEAIVKLPGLGPQGIAELALLRRHGRVRLVGGNGQGSQRRTRRLLGSLAGGEDLPLKLGAEGGVEGWHGGVLTTETRGTRKFC